VNIRMLAAFNIAGTDAELLVRIETLVGYLADGTIEPASFDGDTIASLRLTEAGLEMWPTMMQDATA
jgi:hypothetical protein